MRQAGRVLEIYRARWRVREYHRALKTGCRVGALRLDRAEKLKKAITTKAWVSARVVGVRDEMRRDAAQDCGACSREAEWQLLWLRQHGRAWREADGRPALGEVVRWLGLLGGHQGREADGTPGAEIPSRALYALDLLLEGQRLARIARPDEPTDPPSHQLPRG